MRTEARQQLVNLFTQSIHGEEIRQVAGLMLKNWTMIEPVDRTEIVLNGLKTFK